VQEGAIGSHLYFGYGEGRVLKLTRVKIENYKSVEDSGWVDIGDVTCLVGKNEAGKTAFLQALHRLNPTRGGSTFDETIDFPSRHYAAYKRRKDPAPATVISAVFTLGNDELAAVAAELGEGFLTQTTITLTKRYGEDFLRWSFNRQNKVAVAHYVGQIEAADNVKDRLEGSGNAAELVEAIAGLEEPPSSATAVREKIESWATRSFASAAQVILTPFVPKFFYFDDYSVMPGRASIPDLIERRDAGTLEESDETLIRLLDMVGARLEDFNDQTNFERLTRELEAAANGISSEVFEYWKQNPDLEVQAQVSAGEEGARPPLNVGPILNIRVRNPRHKASVPFDERSKGFVWFFSFFAYFSDLESDSDVILLLDEPGLSLHATAQGDFLSFIDGRLAERHQVAYSTHSPFMIQPSRLDRVRTVEDVDNEGTKVSSEVLVTDSATVFPLQAALGYDLAQTLFIGPDCLLVEGPSDLIYLQILRHALIESGKAALDDRWVITPAGGASNLATFISLLGSNQLNLAVLMDSTRAETQLIRNLLASKRLTSRSIVRMSEFTGNDEADIEDLFEEGFYLTLVNGSYVTELAKPLKVSDLPQGGPRIVRRVEKYFADNSVGTGNFNHYRPAAYFLTEQVKLVPKLNQATLDRAEALSSAVNALLD
jgi:energy-coupling factor transporter ATP-binding protein EcfA2